ncbi:DUF4129 domain-containing protein [Spirosoma oryzicola]|uniref:DUF4129 domain-containing protein n=1 Tax=Spirosoma oryzicola TaxID=2898794 RepID=UPI001E5649CF|nr:DUF4129 domain-containing protein [Spirosoma oryzicola]UHG91690.1 DUF4129 domain-containing protein [Spirosoma oryzicola]
MKVVFNAMKRGKQRMSSLIDCSFVKILVKSRQGVWAMLILVISVHAPVLAQTTKPQTQSVVASDDRSAIRVRYPMPEKLSEFQTDRDYQYNHEAPPPENPVARFFYWLYTKLMRFLRSDAYQNVWQYVILAGVAGFVVYLLMKAEVLGFLFPKKAQTSTLAYENLSENIHAINFDAAIDEAVGQRNFRQAVRLLYLQTLKRLTDPGLIHYKPDKTNQHYINELAKTPLQTDFERLTRQFEFIWYGDFPIDEHQFTLLRKAFGDFSKTQLQTVR